MFNKKYTIYLTTNSPMADGKPNDIFKNLLSIIHNPLYQVFEYYYDMFQILDFWKHGLIIFFHKQIDHTLLSNFKPIFVANIICKLITNINTTFFKQHDKTYHIFNNNQD